MVAATSNRFRGMKVSKKQKFMDVETDIIKLSVSQVLEIQDLAKELKDSENSEDNIRILAMVIQAGCPELVDLTKEEVNEFPMDELSKLSNAIMQYSGLTKENPSK